MNPICREPELLYLGDSIGVFKDVGVRVCVCLCVRMLLLHELFLILGFGWVLQRHSLFWIMLEDSGLRGWTAKGPSETSQEDALTRVLGMVQEGGSFSNPEPRAKKHLDLVALNFC